MIFLKMEYLHSPQFILQFIPELMLLWHYMHLQPLGTKLQVRIKLGTELYEKERLLNFLPPDHRFRSL